MVLGARTARLHGRKGLVARHVVGAGRPDSADQVKRAASEQVRGEGFARYLAGVT